MANKKKQFTRPEIFCKDGRKAVIKCFGKQIYLGARPSELLTMRPCGIDRAETIWAHRPPQHKLLHHGLSREIPLGLAAQAILRPWLDWADDEYCFRPFEAYQWWQKNRTRSMVRKTKIYQNEIKRATAKHRKMPKRKFLPHYNRISYRQAIQHAIAKARKNHPDAEIPRWSPYDLRHLSITRVQDELGWEAAQAHAGHTSPTTTQAYAHKAEQRLLRIAREVQDGRYDAASA